MIELPDITYSAYESAPIATYGGGVDFSDLLHERSLSPSTTDLIRAFQQKGVSHHQQEETNMNQKRIIQIFIADPDKRVPVEDSLLCRGEQKLTDLTDQELFYEIDVKGSLDKHNEKRVKMIDKDATQKAGKDVFLDPIKIRDLKMTVVSIATF